MKMTDTDMRIQLSKFIADAGVSMTVRPIDSNPNMIDGDPRSAHYACKLKVGHSQLTVAFSMGSGLRREPSLSDVLDCLASDASGIEQCAGQFEDWCGEYGYDTDSRKAERTFKICELQATNLKRLLGPSAYETLLWNVERG
jgi:hypothetical protein